MNGWAESEFREFVQEKIMHDPSEKRCQAFVEKVAEKMGLSQWALYKIFNGTNDLTPDRLPVLCNAIREVAPDSDIPRQILAWLVGRCNGFTLLDLNANEPDGRVDDNVDDLMIATANLFKEKTEMLRDGLLDEQERGKLYLFALRVVREACGIIEELKPGMTEVAK